MRKMLLAFVVLLAAVPASAAIQYEFVQRTQSDIEQIPPTDLTGRAIIDGDRSRVDFTGGTQPPYPPGAYVISLDGSRTLTWVDPLSKSYTEMNAAAIASQIGSRNITVTHLTPVMTKLPDRVLIAGIPADHYHLTITYEMTVMYGNMPLTQNVREEIDKWTTLQFGDVGETFLAGGTIRTGNDGLDALIELETTKIKGFPLRQSVKIITSSSRGPLPESKLAGHFSPTRTQTRDLTITSIKELVADVATFTVPVAFKKSDAQTQLEKTKQAQVTILSFDEPPAAPAKP